jgi:hypothetical protein
MDHSLIPMKTHASQSTEENNLPVPINPHMSVSLGVPVDFFYGQPSVNGVSMESAPMSIAPTNEYGVVAPTGQSLPI